MDGNQSNRSSSRGIDGMVEVRTIKCGRKDRKGPHGETDGLNWVAQR